ncbi:uncharacterized protein LOC122848999 isoform X2 [Aphidius gifuensis]|uniref:uncharacterized protein LOC122848999 isoform X2 n=1 Tax=Aphidius gifuensis TaxID=684658 RepID=UPI001CDD507D|nr:uncharacterized protein LOC122848999 isoform X2 [Aphidius gifuensis]
MMESALKKSCIEKEQQLVDDINGKNDFINSLNNDSLAQIFMLLPIPKRIVMERVCLKWKEACELAWYDIKKYRCGNSIGGVYDNRLLTQSYVKKLLLNCSIFLKELFLSKICDSRIIKIVGEHCKNLKKLEFVADYELKINNDDYIQAFMSLDKLKFIKIEIIHMEWRLRRLFRNEIINYLPEEINEIHIIFKECRPKIPILFDLKKFKNVHSLTLSNCNLTKIIQDISEKITLVYLNIENSWVTKKCSYNFEHLFNRLVNLEHISCSKYFVTSNFLNPIFNTCKNIKYLNAPSWKDQILGEIVIENWENLKNMEHLTIGWETTDNVAIKMVKYCKNLQHLDISSDIRKNITDTALQKLTELENLKCLKLPILNDINVESVLAISNNCKELKSLKINFYIREILYCIPVLPNLVFHELSKLQYLEYLDMSGWNH